MEQNRLVVLKRVELGEITLEEGADRLGELEENQISILPEPAEIINRPILDHQGAQSDKREKPAWSIVFWLVPLILGTLLTIFSSTWLYQNYISSGLGFRFWLTWIPFFIGVFMMYIGWELQRARWLHINIKQPKGKTPQRIIIAFPIPFQFMGYILKLFKGKMTANASGFDFAELLETLDQQFKKNEPLFLHVYDEDGTKVEIYIG